VKIKDRDDFKYRKVVVERPITDDSGKPVLKKGKPQPDSAKRDTESIPWNEDVEVYMKKNVYPYAPDAWIDEKKTKIGYEIPFTREFYKYVPPRKSEEIFASLEELDRQEQELMAKIIGK
jgi:type I restriction enzyme M protein